MSAHSLSAEEVETLKRCLQACYAIPFISDVEGFVWEAVFQHVKGLPVPDQIDGERTKQLFDAVDHATKTG